MAAASPTPHGSSEATASGTGFLTQILSSAWSRRGTPVEGRSLPPCWTTSLTSGNGPRARSIGRHGLGGYMAASFEGLSVDHAVPAQVHQFNATASYSHDPMSCFIELIRPRLICR